jgi:hypothetical protein
VPSLLISEAVNLATKSKIDAPITTGVFGGSGSASDG